MVRKTGTSNNNGGGGGANKKKGMSIEEKIDKVEKWFHSHPQPYTLKELLVLIPKHTGVLYQSIEECLELLESENRIQQDKVGIHTLFWWFPPTQWQRDHPNEQVNNATHNNNYNSSSSNSRKNTKRITAAEVERARLLSLSEDECKNELARVKQEETALKEQIREIRLRVGSDEEIQRDQHKLNTLVQRKLQLASERDKYAMYDPELPQKLRDSITATIDAINQWTDNYFILELYVCQNTGLSKREIRQRAHVPVEYDYIDKSQVYNIHQLIKLTRELQEVEEQYEEEYEEEEEEEQEEEKRDKNDEAAIMETIDKSRYEENNNKVSWERENTKMNENHQGENKNEEDDNDYNDTQLTKREKSIKAERQVEHYTSNKELPSFKTAREELEELEAIPKSKTFNNCLLSLSTTNTAAKNENDQEEIELEKEEVAAAETMITNTVTENEEVCVKSNKECLCNKAKATKRKRNNADQSIDFVRVVVDVSDSPDISNTEAANPLLTENKLSSNVNKLNKKVCNNNNNKNNNNNDDNTKSKQLTNKKATAAVAKKAKTKK